MTKAQENRFKKTLEAKRAELLRAIHQRREGLAVERVGDVMDQVRILADRELAVRSVDRLCADLRLVEGALGEIRDGTFGICAQCDRHIPMRRLEAVPWSPYCVSCQERVEQSQIEEETSEFEAPHALAS